MVKMQVEESFVLVATTATFVPPATALNNGELSPNADFRALVIPVELYLLSVVNDIKASRNLRRTLIDISGRPKHRLLRKARLERAWNCLRHSSTVHLFTKSPRITKAPK